MKGEQKKQFELEVLKKYPRNPGIHSASEYVFLQITSHHTHTHTHMHTHTHAHTRTVGNSY